VLERRSRRSDRRTACGSTELAEESLTAIQDAIDREDSSGKADDASSANVNVNVYLHVVRRAPQGEGDMPVARAKGLTLDVHNDV